MRVDRKCPIGIRVQGSGLGSKPDQRRTFCVPVFSLIGQFQVVHLFRPVRQGIQQLQCQQSTLSSSLVSLLKKKTSLDNQLDAIAVSSLQWQLSMQVAGRCCIQSCRACQQQVWANASGWWVLHPELEGLNNQSVLEMTAVSSLLEHITLCQLMSDAC